MMLRGVHALILTWGIFMEGEIKEWIDHLRWQSDCLSTTIRHNLNVLISYYTLLIASFMTYVGAFLSSQWILGVIGIIGIDITFFLINTLLELNSILSGQEEEVVNLLNEIMFRRIDDIEIIELRFKSIAIDYEL